MDPVGDSRFMIAVPVPDLFDLEWGDCDAKCRLQASLEGTPPEIREALPPTQHTVQVREVPADDR